MLAIVFLDPATSDRAFSIESNPTLRDPNCTNLRDLSCRLRCSLRLNARLQNWHLYFFSGTVALFLLGVEAEADTAAAAGMLTAGGEGSRNGRSGLTLQCCGVIEMMEMRGQEKRGVVHEMIDGFVVGEAVGD
jgi:hypothetical protein